jgi:hypothetical protein
VEHTILRDAFVQDADLVDAVHVAPQLEILAQASPPVSLRDLSHFCISSGLISSAIRSPHLLMR